MAKKSQGTLLKIGDGATPTEAFTTIAEVRDITGPGLSLNTEDVTSHDDAGVTHLGTIVDAGEVTFEINFDPGETTHTTLTTKLTSMEETNFQVVFPTATPATWSFAALVTKFEPAAPVGGKLSANVTLRVNGVPTFA